MAIKKTFSERFKEARQATGLSVAKLSERMLIPKRTLQKWDSGERVPPPYVQRFVLNELGDILVERAGREANLATMKKLLESHERWKANHPRPKKNDQSND